MRTAWPRGAQATNQKQTSRNWCSQKYFCMRQNILTRLLQALSSVKKLEIIRLRSLTRLYELSLKNPNTHPLLNQFDLVDVLPVCHGFPAGPVFDLALIMVLSIVSLRNNVVSQ